MYRDPLTGPTFVTLDGYIHFCWGSSGPGLSRGLSKSSARLLSCCTVPVMMLPCLSLTGRSDLLYLPAGFLVVSYSCLLFPLPAACSASSVRLLIHIRLCFLTFLYHFVGCCMVFLYLFLCRSCLTLVYC